MTEPSTEHEDTPTIREVSDKLDSFMAEVRSALSGVHAKASEHEADKLDRPTRTVEGTQQRAASIAEEVQAELAKLRKQEEAEKRTKDLESRVAKAEKAAEKQPREYKRRHYAMGWVTDADR